MAGDDYTTLEAGLRILGVREAMDTFDRIVERGPVGGQEQYLADVAQALEVVLGHGRMLYHELNSIESVVALPHVNGHKLGTPCLIDYRQVTGEDLVSMFSQLLREWPQTKRIFVYMPQPTLLAIAPEV